MPKGYPSIEPRRNHGRAKRTFLKVNSKGPWICAYCTDVVTELGLKTQQGVIHHVDEDPTNDVPTNLVVMHNICHIRHHKADKLGNRKGATVSQDVRERISKSLKGRPAAHGYTDDVRRKIGDVHRGRPHPQRKLLCECGKSCHAGPMKMHTRAQGHKIVTDVRRKDE
jgi:hypothetical protein